MGTGGAQIDFCNNVGLRASFFPPPDCYLAFKTGAMDMRTYDLSGFTGMKWHEVAPYWIKGINDSLLAGCILMNMKKWNKLPSDLKAALLGAERDYFNALIEEYEDIYVEGV